MLERVDSTDSAHVIQSRSVRAAGIETGGLGVGGGGGARVEGLNASVFDWLLVGRADRL